MADDDNPIFRKNHQKQSRRKWRRLTNPEIREIIYKEKWRSLLFHFLMVIGAILLIEVSSTLTNLPFNPFPAQITMIFYFIIYFGAWIWHTIFFDYY